MAIFCVLYKNINEGLSFTVKKQQLIIMFGIVPEILLREICNIKEAANCHLPNQ